MRGVSQGNAGENERYLPGGGSSCSLALPLPSDHISVFSEMEVMGENVSENSGVRLPL